MPLAGSDRLPARAVRHSIIAAPFSTRQIFYFNTVRPLCAAARLPVMGINSSGRARDTRGDGRGTDWGEGGGGEDETLMASKLGSLDGLT